jgi:tungstate transport system substrate-binding protein
MLAETYRSAKEAPVARRRTLLAILTLAALIFAAACGSSSDNKTTPTAGATASSATPAPTKASGTLILATTTSTQDSGLLDVLVPMFEKESGYTVKTVAVGSGQAIEQASRGDADVVLVHSPDAEKKMVDAGDGIERTLVMHNDFIIVGPKDDPAGVKSATTTNDAMKAIAAKGERFISRGDNSGTNALELKLWKAINVTPKGQPWYEESGQGMGATLQIADQKNADTISDRATFLAQKKNLSLEILFQKDKALLNVYHVIVVNPAKHSGVHVEAARAFAAFLVRKDIQDVISKFGVDTAGEPLFFPDAGKPEPAG